MNDDTFEQFSMVLAVITFGHYTSYGALAKLCHMHVRQVQAWLRRLPEGTQLPWHRVIKACAKSQATLALAGKGSYYMQKVCCLIPTAATPAANAGHKNQRCCCALSIY